MTRVVIGMPTYNGMPHLPEAVESLLAQTYDAIAVIIVDDGSADATVGVANEYALLDQRLTVHVNDDRIGMVANFRRAFQVAKQQHPDLEYFAWASDHDVWHPRWVESLVDVLDKDHTVVLAHPRVAAVDDDGLVLREVRAPDIVEAQDRSVRLATVIKNMNAGNMVYGLFRAHVLEACGVYRPVVLPDRLLLAEASLHGGFQQVNETLWHRRYKTGVAASHARQRRSFFPDGAPLYSYLPWWLVHTVVLLLALVVRPSPTSAVSRAEGARLVARYFLLSYRHQAGRRSRRLRKRLRQITRRRPRPGLARLRRKAKSLRSRKRR